MLLINFCFISQLFTSKGVHFNDAEKKIGLSCGSGVTAAMLAIGLWALDRRDVPIYDGSWFVEIFHVPCCLLLMILFVSVFNWTICLLVCYAPGPSGACCQILPSNSYNSCLAACMPSINTSIELLLFLYVRALSKLINRREYQHLEFPSCESFKNEWAFGSLDKQKLFDCPCLYLAFLWQEGPSKMKPARTSIFRMS